jgi:hydroxymethylbilane synthase
MTASRSTKGTVRIGTRGSRLARWQADWVAERLRRLKPGLRVDLVEIKTHGDRDRNAPLAAIGAVGLFTKEIQRAVRDRSVDVAVHSLKDLPTQGLDELLLAAVPGREDAADALIAPEYQTITGLPEGARIGTSSPRRRAQLLFLRPDLQIVTLRGNVETRLYQALERQLDAVVLAWAGLRRLGLERHVTQRLEPSELEGGCTLPMAAWARDAEGDETNHDGPALALDAAVFDPDGCARVAVALRGARTDPDGLGRRAAQALRNQGAISLLGRLLSPKDQPG